MLNKVQLPYSHHDFLEKIGMANLDPDNFWPQKKPDGEISNNLLPQRRESSIPKSLQFNNYALNVDGQLAQ